ncbi:MAG: M23 family metallopeptidase [Peptococcaceae bacterium]|nr:M23 family metallopeptidase [Peptococcaceae bacterium]
MSEKMNDFWENKPNKNRWWVYGLVIALGLSVGVWQGVAEKTPAEENVNPSSPQLIGAENSSFTPITENGMRQMVGQLSELPKKQAPEKTTVTTDNPEKQTAEEDLGGIMEGEPAATNVAATVPNLLIPASGKWERTFGYGYDDTLEDFRFHNGADMPLSLGELVYCALDGKVTAVTEDDYEGQSVTIEHADQIVTKYYGIETDLAVGDTLKAGEVVGQIAASPLFETEQIPHLHFEVWVDGVVTDPLAYIK